VSRLDEYIETAMSRMGLEEPQRAQIEKELRAPLERAVEAALGKGLTRKQAEDQAIRAANQSSFLFKHFGIVKGQRWAYFDYIASLLCRGLLLWPLLLCIFITQSYEHMRDYQHFFLLRNFLFFLVFVVIISGISTFLKMFKRVEIREGLDVRKFLRKPRLIPFDKIKRVRFHHLPFLRINRIVVETAHDSVVLAPEFNGFPAAALALNAFALDRMDKEVQQYLARSTRKIKVRRESPSLRLILTSLWALIVICLFIFMRPLWNGFGVSLPFVGALLAGGIFISLQGYFHKESVKRGLCELLCLAFLLCVGIVVYSAIGDFSMARWLSAWVLAMFIGAMLLLWWRWSRAFLVGVFACGAVAIFSSLYLFPSFYCKELEPLVLATTWKSSDFQILGSEGPIVWLDGTLKAAYLNGEIRSIKLEKPGHWELMSPTPLQEPCVLRKIPHYPYPIRELHIIDQQVSKVKKIVTLPPGNEPYYYRFSFFPIWSPGATYLMTHTEDYKREAVNVEDGSVTRFEDDFSPIQWLDNKTLIGQIIPKWKPQDPNHDTSEDRPECIELWAFDVEKGTKEPFLRRELSEKEKCEIIFHGLKYAFIAYYEIPAADTSHVPPPDSCYIMNIETGDRISVPIPHESQGIYLFLFGGWNEKKETLAYVANPEEQGEGPRIVVVDLKAKNTKERKFSVNEGIANIRLSPNAKRIFFVRILKNDPLLKWFPRWDLWDLEKDEIVPVRSAGFINSFLLIHSYPIWSPDSTWFAYPFMQPKIKGLCHTVEVVKVP